MAIVQVYVEGGVIQHIRVPKGVKVVVYDFDTEDTDTTNITQSPNGEDCIKTVWTNEE